MRTIKIGEPQPVDCIKCGSKKGYQYSDLLQTHYTSFHSADGKYEGGSYSDYSKTLNKAITPYCFNCGQRLGFRLERLNVETV